MNLSINQAAEKASVTQATIYNWIKAGKVSARREGKSWAVSQAELDKCMAGKGKAKKAEVVKVEMEEIASRIVAKVLAELKPLLEQMLARPKESQAQASQAVPPAKPLPQAEQGKPDQSKAQGKPDQNQAKPNGQQARQETKKQESKAEQPDEKTAEKWARENLTEWLDNPCPYTKANGRSWKELAENKGEKISIRGSESSPRAYLHAIENWDKCESVWTKIKAKVALEVVKKETEAMYNHYNHPAERGY